MDSSLTPPEGKLARTLTTKSSLAFEHLLSTVAEGLLEILRVVTTGMTHEVAEEGDSPEERVLLKTLGPYQATYTLSNPEENLWVPTCLAFAFGEYSVTFWDPDLVTIEGAGEAPGLLFSCEDYEGLNLIYDEDLLQELSAHVVAEAAHLEGSVTPLLENPQYQRLLCASFEGLIY